jgi:hypothetical protein
METKVTEEYAYFQPREMIYLLSTKSNERLNKVTAQGKIAETKRSSELLADQQSDPQAEPPTMYENEQQSTDQTDKDEKVPLFDEQVDELIKWSNGRANKYNLTVSRHKERELHFPGSQDLPPLPPSIVDSSKTKYESPQPERRGAFSIIPVEVRVPAEMRNEKNSEGFPDFSKLTDLSLELHNSRQEAGQPFFGKEITIELVIPNWLSSPTSETGGGGGPGSRPLPYTGQSNTEEFKLQFSSTVENLLPSVKLERGKGVKVAILDTAPSLHDLVEAYEVYHKVNPAKKNRDHLLLESLLEQRAPEDPRPTPLTVHHASVEDLMRMRSVHLRDHNYNMTAHGLFVAGLVHSIAPAAEIHLYEVLNFEGVGDLESIARGLWKVAEEQYQVYTETRTVQPLVVNCSLTLNIPLQGNADSPDRPTVISSSSSLPILGHRLTDLNESILNTIRSKSDWVDRGGNVIMWICDLLFWCGARVIAAAGNDRKPEDNQGRPRARFLAAFPSVQGVGALPKDEDQPTALAQTGLYEAASYSDLSDEPEKIGVATFGGEPGERKGVLGVYVGKFPEPEIEVEEPEPKELPILERIRRWIITFLGGIVTLPPVPPVAPKNENHWAWWAGTSFATPILSGVIAAVLSHPNPPRTTEGAIVKLYEDGAIEQAKTTYKEDVLKVTQGS